jgi:DNA-binding response OmpR family regulator
MQKILIVEHDYRVAEIHQKNFYREGLETFVAFDERDTLDIIQKEKIDILLINKQIGGYEFVQKIRKNNLAMKIFVVGIGRHIGGLQEDQKEAIESGANDFIDNYYVMSDNVLEIIMGRMKNDEQNYSSETHPVVNVLFIGDKPDSILNPEKSFFEGIKVETVNRESDLAQFSQDSHMFDVIIAEANSENELGILRKLLEDEKINTSSVIVLLGDDSQGARKKAEELGVSNFLVKSEVSHAQIIERIGQVYNKIKFNSLEK